MKPPAVGERRLRTLPKPAPPASIFAMDQGELADLAAQLKLTVDDLQDVLNQAGLETPDQELVAEQLALWWDDPVRFAEDVFHLELDAWQKRALRKIAKHKRVAMKACKGPGKSLVLAVAIWWFMATRPHANVVATSITAENLRDNLWKELAKWYARSPLLQRAFKWSAERIVERSNPATWWCSARGWAKDADKDQQANTMAGLHGDHVMIVHDESSDYPQGVLAASEGIFATKGQEAKLVQAGNPTRQDGPLYLACTRDRALWEVEEITGDPQDPNRSPRIDVEYAREAIRQHGRENPWVMTNILGQFPNVASDKLLGPNQVARAVGRDLPPAHWKHEAKVMGLDVAWEGDDQSVLIMRQGPVVFRPVAWRNLDTWELADQVMMLILKHHPQAIFVDVVGIGRGVADRLDRLLAAGSGRRRCRLVEVNAGSASSDARYLNKRTQMWADMADAVKKNLALPDNGQLIADLVGPKMGMSDGGGRTFKQALEQKKIMKKRGLPSPDHGDALAMTFAEKVVLEREEPAPEEIEDLQRPAGDWDPYA